MKETKPSKPATSTSCNANNTSMHKLAAMGQTPKFVLGSPKTPA